MKVCLQFGRTVRRILAARYGLLGAVALCIVLGLGCMSAAKIHATLRTVHDINLLSNAEARNGYSVQLEGVVTYSDPEWGALFLEDKTGAIYVSVRIAQEFPVGSHVRVVATTAAGDVKPVLVEPRVTVLRAGSRPRPIPLTLAQLENASADSRFVDTEGVLRPGNKLWKRISFSIFDGAASALVVIPRPESEAAKRLLGLRVRVRGVAGARLDGPGKRVGTQLFVSNLADLEITGPAPADVSASGPRSIGTLNEAEADGRFVAPVHVKGTVTWERRGLFFVSDGSGAVCVHEDTNSRVYPGQLVEVVGFPAQSEHGFILSNATVKIIGSQGNTQALSPLRVTAAEVLKRSLNHRPVALRARLIQQTTTSKGPTFLLEDGGQRFRAVLPSATSEGELVRLPKNAVLELTGVSIIRGVTQVRRESLLVLIGSQADVVLIEGKGWLNLKRALGICGGCALVAIATLIWITQLRRTVLHQTATIRARLERELHLEGQYKRLFERNLAAVFRWRPDGTILDCNAAFAKMLGFNSREEVVGQSYWERHLDFAGQRQLSEALSGESISNRDTNLRRSDGSRVCLLENITAVRTAEGTLYETTAIDVTQLRQHQAELQLAKDKAVHQSLNDVLTGLPNRRHLSERLSAILTAARLESREVALLFIDLDGFKLVNDSFGHSTGDALLIQVASRLKARVRESDTLARLGGDEFIVVLAGLRSKREVTGVAEGLLRILSEPFSIEGHELLIAASIGISLFPENAEEIPELLQQADSAMYAAKREGKNRAVYFTKELGAALRERLNLEQQLRGAIARHEIAVHYQPEFDALSGELVRFEALARWTHPTLGSIPPNKFIPVAEESGLIASLGAYILEQACVEAVKWQAISTVPIQLAVNVSSIQFSRESLASEILAVLEHTGLDPRLLQLELTESVMLSGNYRSQETMERLRAAGISLAIDDFGTGYSCLSSLQASPFDCLKIDRSFIKQLGANGEGEAMVHSVVALAHNLGMRVIVEGIENPAQLDVIKRLGGDEVQGFLMGRPTLYPGKIIESVREKHSKPSRINSYEQVDEETKYSNSEI